jgi:serine/threonine-protein kinase
MAELFLAYLPGPGGFKKFVALKQILPDVKADDAFVKMFLDEARITAAFNHANIGQVFDLGEDENSEELYLAMEFIAGQNLEQVIKRAAKREVAIPVGFAARVVRDACLGLHYAHTFKDPTGNPMAVVHRDVSPKNVMVTYTGQVKMIDFGIAKAKGRLNRTQIGIVKGTSGYMSPEQVRNEPLDGRTDLFAAGVMLHEMLCGERLFTANTDAAMMIKIVDEDAKDPTEVNPAVSPDFAQVVLKMLAKDRAQRFANGKDVARAIDQACPEMFDDEQLAEVMGQLFEDKIALTRSLLEMADDDAQDEASISEAVQGLTTGEEARARKTDGMQSRTAATPPRPPPRAAASSQRLPKVPSRPHQAQPPPPPRPVSNPQRTQIRSPSRAVLPPVVDDVEGESTIPPRAPPARASQARVKPVDEEAATPPRAPRADSKPAPEPKQAPEQKKKKGGGGGIIAVLLLLLLVGGGGWAVTKGPFKDKAQALLKAQIEEPVVDTTAKPVDPAAVPAGAAKPSWIVDKEKAEAAIAAEKARQKEIEEAANDPELKRQAEEAQKQLEDINRLEEEQRQLKIAVKEGKGAGEQNKKQLESLQKQIDELKGLLKDKANKTPSGATASVNKTPAKPKEREIPADGLKAEDVAVVKDTGSARRHDVGFLTITTTNPTSATLLLGTTELGSSPLVKAPIDIGHHELKVVDGDGKVHVLSVTIKAGETLTFTNINVGTLPPAP